MQGYTEFIMDLVTPGGALLCGRALGLEPATPGFAAATAAALARRRSASHRTAAVPAGEDHRVAIVPLKLQVVTPANILLLTAL